MAGVLSCSNPVDVLLPGGVHEDIAFYQVMNIQSPEGRSHVDAYSRAQT